MKKESLQTTTVKTLLAVLLFAGMGVIIIGGGCIIWEYTKMQDNNKTVKIIEKDQEEELLTYCETDSDCESYFSRNICKSLCANENEKNQKILDGFNKTCDPTLRSGTRLECECVNNKCQQVVGERPYDILEKKCDGDSCCLDSLEYMKENNYKETKRSSQTEKKHICPSGFKARRLDCYTFLNWCEPIEEEYCFDEQNNRREIGETWSESPTIFTECNEFGRVIVNHILSCVEEKLIISAGYSSNENNIYRNTPSLPFSIGTDGSLKYTWIIDSNKYTEFSGGPTGVFASCENGKATMFWYGGMSETHYSKTFFDGNYKTVISCLDSYSDLEEETYGIYGKTYDEDDPKNFTINRVEGNEKMGKSKLLENGKEICRGIKERYQELEETVIDTSYWQTYRNEDFGFEFQYPENWDTTDKYEGYLVAFNPDDYTNILVNVQNYDSELSVEEWVISGLEEGMNPPVISRKNEVINGLEMFRLIAWDGNEFERVFILKENKLFVFLFAYTVRDTKVKDSIHHSSFETILSTFKFIEK